MSGASGKRSYAIYIALSNVSCEACGLSSSVETALRLAIEFARFRHIGRSNGGNAVRTAAYNGRADIRDERSGQRFYFAHRESVVHHEVMLPEGADASFADSRVLWNAAEMAEKRIDAQVARELLLALPANDEISNEDRLEMVRSFVQEHFVSKGLAAQVDIHAPHTEDEGSEKANWHAHVLLTTRRVEGDRLSAKKARDLNPEFANRGGGRGFVAAGEGWQVGKTWRDHQNAFFRARGYEARVDATAREPGVHLGPVRLRKALGDIIQRLFGKQEQEETQRLEPGAVLDGVLKNSPTFSERDLDRYLAKHAPEGQSKRDLKAAVLKQSDVIRLYDPQNGDFTGRYTTEAVRREELRLLKLAQQRIAQGGAAGVSKPIVEAVKAGSRMRVDQARAFDHAVGYGGLKIIAGRAGTGKSYVLDAVRKAYERGGFRVVGLAPTNTVAQDLKGSGFSQARTIHSALFALKNGRESWDRKTVLIVDEAAMLSTGLLSELLTEVNKAGAKVILAGDDRQLASIERGGMFAQLQATFSSAEISEVVRQRVDWQREAARDLAEGRFQRAIGSFDRHGAIIWTDDQEDALSALVAAWKADSAADPPASRFVFAYTNTDVDGLNTALRAVRRQRGELGEDVALPSARGVSMFAVGDRVQITQTNKTLGLLNGQVGRIERVEGQSLRVRLDAAPGKPGQVVSWSTDAFRGFRHGYAGTIYKGQGKTLDHSYLYHTHHWRNASSYVALTRQRQSAKVFVSRETARDVGQLARQMGRSDFKTASLAYATEAELQAKRKREAERAAREGQAAQDRTPAAANQEHAAERPAPNRSASVGQSATRNGPQRRDPAREREDAAVARRERVRVLLSQTKQERMAQGGYRAVTLPAEDRDLRAVLEALQPEAANQLRFVRSYVIKADFSWQDDTYRPESKTDMARAMDASFDAAFQYRARLSAEVQELERQIKANGSSLSFLEGTLEDAERSVGFLGAVANDLGVWRNRRLSRLNAEIDLMEAQQAERGARLETLAGELADAQKVEGQAYDRIGSEVEAEWAARERIATVAQDLASDRHRARREQEEERYREQERELERRRDLGLEWDDGIEL